MRTTPQERIDEFTTAGWWGTRTLDDYFRECLTAAPDAVALTDPPNRAHLVGGSPRRLTWRQIEERVERLATRLSAAGFKQGQVAVIQFPNIVDQPVVYLALIRLGVILSPVPVQYAAHELRMIAEQTRPVAYLTVGEFRGTDFLGPRRAAFPAGTLIGTLGGQGEVDLADIEPSDADRTARTRNGEAVVDANDVMTICWTSGTTGQPKGVPRSHNQWLSIGRSTAEAADLQPGDAMLNPFPFVNMASFGGFLIPWLVYRGRLDLHHPFDLPVFLSQLGDGVNFTVAPPAVLTMLLAQPELLGAVDLSHLRVIGSGSAPLSPSMVRGWQERYQINIINMFGSNEGASLTSSAADVPDPALRAKYFRRQGAAGLVWSGTVANQMRTRLVDQDSGAEATSAGSVGELQVWGPTVFDGYLDSPEANAAVFSSDGFFRTGDLFEIAPEDERFYRFVGRSKDIIVRGGMKISPDELDALLVGQPGIASAAVAGYPDEVLDERVGVVAVPKEGVSLTLDDVTGWFREQGIAVFKLPERLVLVDEIPVNPLGKVLRHEVAKLLAAPTGAHEPAVNKLDRAL